MPAVSRRPPVIAIRRSSGSDSTMRKIAGSAARADPRLPPIGLPQNRAAGRMDQPFPDRRGQRQGPGQRRGGNRDRSGQAKVP